jgi:hypothetical protein
MHVVGESKDEATAMLTKQRWPQPQLDSVRGRRVMHTRSNNGTKRQPARPPNERPSPLRGNDPARELASGNSLATA